LEALREIQDIMWSRVGLVRCHESLTDALDRLAVMEESVRPAAAELRNAILVARLITTAALLRKESRGVHYRSDWADPLPEWNRHIFLQEPAARAMVAEAR
jgi:L-aspartate oxidase